MNEHAYSAKLVFKVIGMPKEHGRWLYEERIVCLTARDHEAAYEKAVRIGRNKAFRGWRFLGVANMIRHDPIFEEDDVWYELKTSKDPERLVPPKRIVLKNLASPSSSPPAPKSPAAPREEKKNPIDFPLPFCEDVRRDRIIPCKGVK